MMPETETTTEHHKKFICDKCGKEFQNANGLGFHRRAMHGIPGKFSKKNERQKQQGKVQKRSAFICPKCGKEFAFAKALGKHLSAKHGIPGSSNSAMHHRAKKRALEIAGSPPMVVASDLACGVCGKGPFKNMSGLQIHLTTMHGKQGAAFNGNSAGHSHETNEVAIAFWVSQAARDCEDYAKRVELGTEDFASRVLAVVSGSSKTLRARYRLSN